MLSNKTCHSLIGSDRRANESQHGSAACSKYYGELDTSLVTPTCCKTLNAIWLSLRDSGTAVSTEGSERHGEHLPQPQKPHSLRLRCARCCSPGFIPKKTLPALWERTKVGFSSTWRKLLVFSPVDTPRDGFAEAGDRGTSTWQSKRSSPKSSSSAVGRAHGRYHIPLGTRLSLLDGAHLPRSGCTQQLAPSGECEINTGVAL